MRELLRDIPAGNIIAEPSKRDTAAAVALGVAWVAARNHTAAMVVLPADHVIKETAAFQKIIRDAVEAAKEKSALITIGIRPASADPGFGYIEMGEANFRQTRSFPGRAFPRETECRPGRILYPQRKFSLECRHVRLDRADDSDRV